MAATRALAGDESNPFIEFGDRVYFTLASHVPVGLDLMFDGFICGLYTHTCTIEFRGNESFREPSLGFMPNCWVLLAQGADKSR